MRTEDVHPRVTLIKSSNPHLAGGEKRLFLCSQATFRLHVTARVARLASTNAISKGKMIKSWHKRSHPTTGLMRFDAV